MTKKQNHSSLTNRYKFDSYDLNTKLSFIRDTQATEPSLLTRPTVYYTPLAKAKMDFIVNYCEQEVGWMGLVEREGTDFIITDFFVPEQTVSAVETDIEEEAMHKLAMRLMDEEKDPSQLYAWFHSHVDMNVSPSKQDEEETANFLEMLPVFIRGIINKRGQYKVDVYLRDLNIIHTNVVAEELPPMLSEQEQKALEHEIDTNVTERSYTYPGFNKGFLQNNNIMSNTAWQQRHNTTLPIIDDRAPAGPVAVTQQDTGYGVDWTVYTPMEMRPDGWDRDPEYLQKGQDLDWDLWAEYPQHQWQDDDEDDWDNLKVL